MAKRRFQARGKQWCSGDITLTRAGQEFDTETEADKITLIEKTKGSQVIEVPPLGVLQESFVDTIKQSDAFKVAVDEEIARRAQEVEPVSVPNISDEIRAAEDLKAEREAEEKAEQKAIEERKAKKEAETPKVIRDFKAKSPKVQAQKQRKKANG